jgi:hypothetical protein
MAGGDPNETITSRFYTRISSTRQSSAADPVSWREGLPLTLAVTLGGALPVMTITLGPTVVLGGPDNAQFAYLLSTREDELVVNIDLADAEVVVCQQEPQMYLKASATIDASGRMFTGAVTSTCVDQATAGAYLWTGESTSRLAAETIRRLRRALRSQRPTAETEHG